jgi:hypothetical protein
LGDGCSVHQTAKIQSEASVLEHCTAEEMSLSIHDILEKPHPSLLIYLSASDTDCQSLKLKTKFEAQRTYACKQERKMFISVEKLPICKEELIVSFKILTSQ